MATRSNKSALTVGNKVLPPDLNPKDPDLKYTGTEPLFAHQPDADRRRIALVLSFNWYGRYYQQKDAKQFLVQYAIETGQTERIQELQRAEDREIFSTLGWLARMHLRGLELTDSERTTLASEIVRLADSVARPTKNDSATAPVQQTVNDVVSARNNIQEIMKERAREVAGELEGWFDEFVENGAREVNIDPISALAQRNVLPQHISILTEVWKRHLAEYQLVLENKDAQLQEAYKHFSKTQIKALIKFCEAVLAGLGSYVSIKKSTKTKPRRKPQSAEKISSKLKYLKTWENIEQKLKLVSVHPAKIIGASEIYLFDTAKRKIHYYIADSHIGSLNIKGTTIVGFDETNSGVKTVRKPGETVNSLLSAGKPAGRKLFKDIRAVQTKPNGRTNENLIILKVS
jgi:hypothetical protein